MRSLPLLLLLFSLTTIACEETVYRPGEPPKSVELSDKATTTAVTAASASAAASAPANEAAAPTTNARAALAPASDAAAQAISDADLERYVSAFIKLQVLEQRTQHRIDEAAKKGDKEAIKRAAEEADVVARGILSESRIDREEFTRIREQIQNDPELSARGKAIFDRMLKEAGLTPGQQ
ncbi:MAG: DUF4168 domain-containing protein [Candidatus Dadabacteria bacterium]|nr:MAG: DUF4168 domain-containing protein [Candidatus Dadabacteria bacterium]